MSSQTRRAAHAAPRPHYKLSSGNRHFIARGEIEAFEIIRRHDIEDVTIVKLG